MLEYKRSAFQLGLQARNVNKSEKKTDRTALFISKPVKYQQQRENKDETIRDKGIEERKDKKIEKKKRRKEKRRKRREEQKIEEKRKKKNRLRERESMHFTDALS